MRQSFDIRLVTGHLQLGKHPVIITQQSTQGLHESAGGRVLGLKG